MHPFQQHFCSSDLSTRFASIVSFTHEKQFIIVKRIPKTIKTGLGANFEPVIPVENVNTPLNIFTTLVVQQNGLITALRGAVKGRESDPNRLIVDMKSARNLRNYLNIRLPMIGADGIVSMYLFSKLNSKESDHRWVNRNGSPVKRCLYLIQLVTSSQQLVLSDKIMQAVYQSNRINPDFTLALDANNTGFAIHKDIYRNTEDFSFYIFNYVLQDKVNSLEDHSLESPFRQLHHFQATRKEKTVARYFYLELTNSPNEVQIICFDEQHCTNNKLTL